MRRLRSSIREAARPIPIIAARLTFAGLYAINYLDNHLARQPDVEAGVA